MKWHYKVIRLTSRASENEEDLYAAGNDGWELVAVIQPDNGLPLAYLKRPQAHAS